MDKQQQPPSKSTSIGLGVIAGGGGLYFMLIALGLVPPPEGAHAPPWIVFCAGLAFFVGGIAVATRGVTPGDPDPTVELPVTAPRWLRVLQYVTGLAIAASLALIGTWIAFGSGTREFNVTGPFSGMGTGEAIGRIVFGFGAVLTWLALITLAVGGGRKLFGRAKS